MREVRHDARATALPPEHRERLGSHAELRLEVTELQQDTRRPQDAGKARRVGLAIPERRADRTAVSRRLHRMNASLQYASSIRVSPVICSHRVAAQ
ncbi:hypothetical protein QUG98_10000 [Curtobacterium sp. RHCJP20]|uniref:Uncharacterized protein n=1 Tax=Curtobacterium subtropicum TaxID=3055138 RepID=A0ABT7THD8_9MICO|nr:hypothetical protein [Curtobacterium subtropicum]MDM7888784.1 hypothetical protein [Curtobacterium subtropicum]